MRLAAAELHLVELLAARNLDFQLLGQRVDDGDADAVQPARGVVDLAVELSARVQRRHDDFEGGLALELGMGIDGNAAAVVGHGEKTVHAEFHLDPGGMSRDGLVHGVVDHLGEEVVQRALVGATDIHAGPAPHGLEAFQHLDIGSRVAVGGLGKFALGTRHGLISCSLLLVVSDIEFQRMRGRRLGLLGRLRRRPDQLQIRLRRLGGFRLRLLRSVRSAEQVAQGPECHERSPSLA